MKSFFILVAVFGSLAIAVELAYLRCLKEVKKMKFRLPKRRVVKSSPSSVFTGRPELDFDLHVGKKVDKLRFGDEV